MKCPQCGRKVESGARFCRSCGVSLDVSRQGPAQSICWKRVLPWTALGIVVLTLLLLAYLAGASMQSAARIRTLDPGEQAPVEYILTSEQAEVLQSYGAPEAFTILFYTEENADGALVSFRHESWTYYSSGMEVTFVNGRLLEETQLSFSGEDLQQLPYRPEQFRAFMSLNDVSAVLGGQDVLEIPVEPELAQRGRVYYAGQLSFAMADGELVYVETIPVQDAGE